MWFKNRQRLQCKFEFTNRIKKQICKVLPNLRLQDLTAMQSDLVINQIVTSKVETEIQQKSYL